MSDLIPKILLIILIIVAYLLVLEHTAQYVPKKKNLPAFAIVLLFIYLCMIGFVVEIYRIFDHDPMVLMWTLIVGVVLMIIYLIRLIILNWKTTNKVMFGLLVAYMLIILYVTVIDRIGTYSSSEIRMSPFSGFKYYFATGYKYMIGDFMRNFCLFLPLGVLIPVINKEKFRRLSYAAFVGVIVSTGIEAAQLFGKLGTCDIDDIIANTLGTVMGYIICDLALRVSKNWKLG